MILDRDINSGHILTLATDFESSILFVKSASSPDIELIYKKDHHCEQSLDCKMVQ